MQRKVLQRIRPLQARYRWNALCEQGREPMLERISTSFLACRADDAAFARLIAFTARTHIFCEIFKWPFFDLFCCCRRSECELLFEFVSRLGVLIALSCIACAPCLFVGVRRLKQSNGEFSVDN